MTAAAPAARLSAAGPRVQEHTRFTTVEAEVPDTLSADAWRAVLDAVADGYRFGLLATSLNGRTYGRSYAKRSPRQATLGDRAISDTS